MVGSSEPTVPAVVSVQSFLATAWRPPIFNRLHSLGDLPTAPCHFLIGEQPASSIRRYTRSCETYLPTSSAISRLLWLPANRPKPSLFLRAAWPLPIPTRSKTHPSPSHPSPKALPAIQVLSSRPPIPRNVPRAAKNQRCMRRVPPQNTNRLPVPIPPSTSLHRCRMKGIKTLSSDDTGCWKGSDEARSGSSTAPMTKCSSGTWH